MTIIIVNAPTGEQQEIEIDKSGSYFDESLIVWDDRKDKPLPENYTLGKLARDGTGVYELPGYVASHAEYIVKQEQRLQAETKKAVIAEAVEKDKDFEALRSMTDSQIDEWFSANVTSKGPTEAMLKKVVKALIKQEIL